MRPQLGPLSRGDVPRWDAIDWFASTTRLNAAVMLAVHQRYPWARVHAGYRSLDRNTVAFTLHGTDLGLAEGTDREQITDDIGRIATETFATRGWIMYR